MKHAMSTGRAERDKKDSGHEQTLGSRCTYSTAFATFRRIINYRNNTITITIEDT